MAATVRILLSLTSASFRGEAVYRRSFWLGAFGTLVATCGELVAVFIILGQFGAIGGWTPWEILFAGGLATFSFATAHALAGGLELVPDMIRGGEMDRLLVRPVSPLGQVIANGITWYSAAPVLQGLVLAVIAAVKIGISWTVFGAAMMLVSVLATTIIYLGLFIAAAAATFWTVQRVEAFNIFTFGGSTLTQYPVSIYRTWLRNIFIFAVPIGLTTYYPVLVALGKADATGLGIGLAWLALPVSVLFLFACCLLWRAGINRYQSTGS